METQNKSHEIVYQLTSAQFLPPGHNPSKDLQPSVGSVEDNDNKWMDG